MNSKLMSDNLIGIIKQFEYYKNLGNNTLAQLSFEDMQYRPNQDSNSISIIVKHMVGNMLSRWTNFLTEDGEKPWRDRDREFEPTYTNKEELLREWEKGWKCLFEAIHPLSDADLQGIVYIRNEGHSIHEALIRQLAHYPYHIGQMVFVGKLLKGPEWQNLSVPKGASKVYNQAKFDKPKGREHFTDGA